MLKRVIGIAGVVALAGATLAFVLGPEGADASAEGACLSRPLQADEQELLRLHRTWRDQYIPGSDPSQPLEGSAPLQAAALGLAVELASGALAPGGVTPEVLAERLVLCGYPANLATGGRGITTLPGLTPEGALTAMTAEIWGGGIRVPANLNGFPMRCVAAAHATVEGGEAWIILVFAGAGGCPQETSSEVQPFGAPTATPTFPFPATPTRTPTPPPTATPTATPTPPFFRLFTNVARD
jgi:hypothetical protein